jgi:hypothetical protein
LQRVMKLLIVCDFDPSIEYFIVPVEFTTVGFCKLRQTVISEQIRITAVKPISLWVLNLSLFN